MKDFPNYPAIITCPLSGRKTLNMSQAWLDEVTEQDPQRSPYSLSRFDQDYPNFTTCTRQVDVLNPYTQQMVKEITPAMLSASHTNLQEHLERFAKIVLGKPSRKHIRNPFNGKKTFVITNKDLESINKTVLDFYQAVCAYPLRQYQVKCAICSEWINNIWDHLDEVKHAYATPMSIDEFLIIYGTNNTKRTITNNAYVESKSGESTHMGDFLAPPIPKMTGFEVQDSLMAVATDELDKKIAMAISKAHNVDDIFYLASNRNTVRLPFDVLTVTSAQIKEYIKKQYNITDFDIAIDNQDPRGVVVMVPGRQTLRIRINRMYKESDLDM
jgi:hypothetical protein